MSRYFVNISKFPEMEILWKLCRDIMEIGRTLEMFLKLNWTQVRNFSKIRNIFQNYFKVSVVLAKHS